LAYHVQGVTGRKLDLNLRMLGSLDEIAVLYARTLGKLVPGRPPKHASAAVEDRD